MDQHGTTISELVKATGISRDIVNKLLARENSSTVVENALLVSHFYGKSLEQFMNCEEVDAAANLGSLINLLQPSERQLLEAQVRGILQHRNASLS